MDLHTHTPHGVPFCEKSIHFFLKLNCLIFNILNCWQRVFLHWNFGVECHFSSTNDRCHNRVPFERRWKRKQATDWIANFDIYLLCLNLNIATYLHNDCTSPVEWVLQPKVFLFTEEWKIICKTSKELKRLSKIVSLRIKNRHWYKQSGKNKSHWIEGKKELRRREHNKRARIHLSASNRCQIQ